MSEVGLILPTFLWTSGVGMSNNVCMDIDTLIHSAGGVGKFASKLNVSHSTICDWRRSGFIPGARAIQVSRLLGLPLDDISLFVRVPKSPNDGVAI